ncbi:MAG: 4-hydroxy-3-methylbut-2-enyl diphosphate reductase [Solitalea-like symbiont of Tyrophagus putrescentiae]
MLIKTKLNLQVEIDERSGFCFGVVYAINMAEEILQTDKHLYCLGDIVHNDEEIYRLQNLGLEIIDHEQLKNIKNKKVLIRAHGEPPETYKIALDNNIALIDASCPVVLKLQNRIKQSSLNQETIIIYGKPGHAEVIGLKGQTHSNAIVIQDIEDLNNITLPENITLYSQTTQNTDGLYKIKDALVQLGYKLNFKDTICNQVSSRRHLEDFTKKFNKIVFVAGKKSSNGKVLFNLCKKNNINSIFVSQSKDLDMDFFESNDTVGICGATSTPMWLMLEIKNKLLTF